MTTITIDEVEYNVEDFTEKQQGAYQDLMYARAEMQRLEYLYRVLEGRTQMLAKAISDTDVVEEEASDG